jgi:hypothetical protein
VAKKPKPESLAVVDSVIQKFEYDVENPPQYQSPDSTNIYTVIARRVVGEDVQEIGMNLMTSGGNLQIRFCVFADTQPQMGTFSFRYSSKKYQKFPLAEDPVLRTGCSLDLVTVPVAVGPYLSRQAVVQALEADEGWDKLSSWVTLALEQEGFVLIMDAGQFVGLWPKMMSGVGLEAPVVDIQYPGPLIKKSSAPKVAFAADNHENHDEDLDDNSDD